MTNELNLISEIPVSVNHYMKPRSFVTYITKGGKKVPIAQVTMYETAEAKEYKKKFTQYVIEEITKQGWNLVPNKTQHFYVDCDFVFPRLDMDANNYFKIMLDSITDTQLIWLDDNVTCERVNSIQYNSKNPYIKLKIYPVDYIGIFKNEQELTTFKDQYCLNCKRFKRNCKILNTAIEGKIQEELITEGELKCIKFNKI